MEQIYGRTFYGVLGSSCWKIEVNEGGFITTGANFEGTVCSKESFNGIIKKSKFDSFFANVSYWSKDIFDLGGEIQFLESNEVSKLVLELISLRGDERFVVTAKLPSCEKP